MTYRTTEYYGTEALERELRRYDPEELKRALGYAVEDLAAISRYVEKLKEHIVKTKGIELKYYVDFHKGHNYASKHINYRANVYQLPDIPDAEKVADRVYPYLSDAERVALGGKDKGNPFLGNEKKAAIQFARNLSKKYGNCPITGNAADLIKPEKDVIKI